MAEHVRKAEIADASRIAEIIVSYSHEVIHERLYDDPAKFNKFQVLPLALHYQNDKGALKGIRVYDDGIIKGVLYMTQNGKELEVDSLYVDPLFHNAGVGQALSQAAAETLAEKDAEVMRVWVNEQDLHKRMLYSNAGFETTGNRRPDPNFDKDELEYIVTKKGE